MMFRGVRYLGLSRIVCTDTSDLNSSRVVFVPLAME